jgi:hypothetical protein
VRKVYKVVKDAKAEKSKYLRIIDESGEDYLYPASYFCEIKLPPAAQQTLLQSATH